MYLTPDELTKYELCRIIGLRALQISEDIMIRYEGDPYVTAVEEILNGTLEFSVRRYLPNNTFEDRHSSTLTIPYSYIKDAYRNPSNLNIMYNKNE